MTFHFLHLNCVLLCCFFHFSFLFPGGIHTELSFKEICVLFHQKVDSRVESGNFIVEGETKISSKLGYIPIFQKLEISMFFSEVHLIDSSFF